MKFLWRIFFAVYVAFLVVLVGISWVYTEWIVGEERGRFIEEKVRVGDFLAEEVELYRLRSELPFGLLRRITEGPDFEFWWIVDSAGRIYQSDDVAFVGSSAFEPFPVIEPASVSAEIFFDEERNLGVVARNLNGGKNSPALWLGYSTVSFESIRRRSLNLTFIIAIASLGVFGLVLYFTVQHLTSPLDELVKGTHALTRGDFDYRVELKSDDELGELGQAFNEMTREIQNTTQALRRSEEHYRTTINSLNEWIVVVDSEQRVVIANEPLRRWLRNLGVEHDVSGLRLQEAMECLNKESLGRVASVIEMGKPSSQEITWRVNDREIQLEIDFIPIENASGHRQILIVLVDVTEKRKAAVELQRVQRLDSLGVLAGGIAHDFNNILGAIVSRVNVASLGLKQSEGKDSVIADLEAVEEAAMRAVSLTTQLLTFSKGGAPILNPGSLADLIDESTRFILSGKNVGFRSALPRDLWAIKMDAAQISQVIQNIVLNACQAMPNGGLIQITGENIEIDANHNVFSLKPGSYVKASISDQGNGIGAIDLPHIFDPFFSTKESGHGLGLAVAYSIVKNHHGYIEVETKEGVGTSFHLYLQADPEVVLVGAPTPPDSIGNGAGHILLMDDDVALRNAVKKMAISLGFEVTSCGDGEEAISLYREAFESGTTFDAVILDLTVPGGMGGEEAMERLIAIDPNICAIVTSGYSGSRVMADYKAFGFSGVLSKPFNRRRFNEVMRSVTE